MHVEALHRAAALAGVVHGAIGQAFGGGQRVGIGAHVGRVLAAELELQLQQLGRHRLRDAQAGGMAAGEEHAVQPLRQQRRAHLAGAHQALHHVGWHAGGMQQSGEVQPRQRGVFGGLVEHHIAGQQRRHDDIAADEPGVVPGRDVGHHAQRDVRDLLAHAAAVEDLLVADRGFGLLQEEVDARQQAVELVAGLGDGLAHLQRQGVRQGVELGNDAGAEALHDGQLLVQRHAAPRRAARRAPRRPWRRRWRRRRRWVRRAARRWRGCGSSAWAWWMRAQASRVARAAERNSLSIALSSKLPSSESWNSGCHCTAAT